MMPCAISNDVPDPYKMHPSPVDVTTPTLVILPQRVWTYVGRIGAPPLGMGVPDPLQTCPMSVTMPNLIIFFVNR